MHMPDSRLLSGGRAALWCVAAQWFERGASTANCHGWTHQVAFHWGGRFLLPLDQHCSENCSCCQVLLLPVCAHPHNPYPSAITSSATDAL